MKRRWLSIVLLLGAAQSFAQGAQVNWAAVRDSLGDIEPWLRPRWLVARRLSRNYYARCSWKPTTDSGLRCVGRWSYGPSVRVSLRATAGDTIVCLARGSGASLIRFCSQDSLTLQLLSDINCNGIASRAIIRDTLVFCGMKEGGTGIEVWDVSDLSHPHRLSYVYLPSVMDIAVRDTFLYSIGYQQDSLRVFNVANPSNPYRVGACADSGIHGVCVAGNYCYLADQYGLYIVDVSNPTNPHRVAAIGGYEALAVTVRDTLCYVGTYNGSDFALRVYNVKDPATPFPIGSLAGIEAHDIYLPPTCDTVLYTPKLHVINITNPASPRQIGFVDCPGWDYGVVAVPALGHALAADYFKGMVAVNLSNPAAPLVDTAAYAGDRALDITIDDGKAYLASYHAGLQILDVSDPTKPAYLGCYDTAGTAGVVRSATARDSFAYASWPAPRLLSIDVTDPLQPLRAAGCAGMFNPTEDMVIRDSFVFCAEMNRLQIVNVARPREPVLVGSCVAGDATSAGLCVEDTLAYVGNFVSDVVNVKNPANPVVVGSLGRGAWNVTVRDTFAFVSSGGVIVYSVAQPGQPRRLDSLSAGPNTFWVEAVGTLLYTGNRDGVRVVDASDIHNMRVRGFSSTPYTVKRLTYESPYIYAACWEAGVSIYESTQVAVSEPKKRGDEHTELTVRPNPAPTNAVVSVFGASLETVAVRDIAGRVVPCATTRRTDGVVVLNLTQAPPGVYFVEGGIGAAPVVVKFVRQ